MKRSTSHALRASIITSAGAAAFVLTAGPASAETTNSVTQAIADVGVSTNPIALGGIGLMAAGVVLIALSLILKRRAAR